MEPRLALHQSDSWNVFANSGACSLSLAQRLLAWSKGWRLERALADGADPASDPLLAYRAAKITSPGARRDLAFGLRGVVAREERPAGLSSAAPISLAGVRRERGRLLELANRIEADRTVGVRGVAEATLLLTDGASSLWAGGDPTELSEAIDKALAGLGG